MKNYIKVMLSIVKFILLLLVLYVNTYYLVGNYDLIMPIASLNISNYGISIVYLLAFFIFIIDFIIGNVLKNEKLFLRVVYSFVVKGLYSLMAMIAYYGYTITQAGVDSIYFTTRWLKFGLEKKWLDTELLSVFNEICQPYYDKYPSLFNFISVEDKLIIINTMCYRKMSILKNFLIENLEATVVKHLKFEQKPNAWASMKQTLDNITIFASDHKVAIGVTLISLAITGVCLYYYFSGGSSSESNINSSQEGQLARFTAKDQAILDEVMQNAGDIPINIQRIPHPDFTPLNSFPGIERLIVRFNDGDILNQSEVLVMFEYLKVRARLASTHTNFYWHYSEDLIVFAKQYKNIISIHLSDGDKYLLGRILHDYYHTDKLPLPTLEGSQIVADILSKKATAIPGMYNHAQVTEFVRLMGLYATYL